MRVKFNDPDEFIEELKKSAPMPKVLRVVRKFDAGMKPTSLSVVATAVHGQPGASHHVLYLETYVGQLFGFGDADERTNGLAEKVADKLKAAAAELGLDVRSGVFEE